MMIRKHISGPVYFAVIILFAVLLWAGLLYMVVRESKKLDAVTAELLLEQEKIQNADSLNALLAKTEADRAKLDGYFVTEDKAAVFLERIEALATSSRVALTVTNFEKLSNESVLRLSFTGKGSFAGVYQLSRALEVMPLRISIERLSLRTMTEGGWEGLFVVRLESFLPKES